MKKKISVLIFLILSMIALVGCGSGPSQGLQPDKTNVVTSFYPLYYLASQIGGDHVHVINLVPAGVEPHDWTPKSKDIRNMTNAKALVYQGAGFEGWVGDFLGSLKDTKPVIIEASQGVSLIKGNPESESGGKANENDPHAWLSPRNAIKMAENIKNGLVQADPDHRADYETNYKRLTSSLEQLDQRYRDALAKVPNKEIVVSHQAFAYLCRDYGLTQKAIMGLSPDAEPTARDMKDILDFIKANHVKTIFFEELVSDKLAKTLAKDAGISTLVLNPLEGLTEEQAKAGSDYISIMDANLQNLLKALQ